MPYFEIDEDTYNSLDDSVKQNFNAYQPEDVEGLKTNANKILNEKKALSEKLAAVETEFEQLKSRPQGGDKALQEKLDSAMKEYSSLKESHAELQNNIVAEKRGKAALEIASSLSSDSKRQALLAEKIGERISLNGSDVVVLSKDGQQTISSLNDLKQEINQEYDFLCDGNKSRGGGAAGNSGGATSVGNYQSPKYGNIGAGIAGFNSLPAK